MAVFRSWDAPKAVTYRQANGIDHDGGTAVTSSAWCSEMRAAPRGRASRSPAIPQPALASCIWISSSTRKARMWLPDAESTRGDERLRRTLPSAWAQLEETGHALEALFRDAQDFEFTHSIRHALLASVALREAHSLGGFAHRRRSGGRGTDKSSRRLCRASPESIWIPSYEPAWPIRRRALGPRSSRQHGSRERRDRLGFGSRQAHGQAGTPVILVRRETETADIGGMMSAIGILTASRRPDLARGCRGAATWQSVPGRLPGSGNRSPPALLPHRRGKHA